jgi:hypothetical protein
MHFKTKNYLKKNHNNTVKHNLNGLGFAEKLHLILEDSLLIINSFKYLSSVSTC